jgi:uncharacterized protein (DUF4415 family)
MAKEKLSELMWRSQLEDNISTALRDEVPDAWHRLEADLDVVEPKVRVTLRIDASVAKFYRAMGQGYQARINRILETWAQMKIAGVVEAEAQMEAMMMEGVQAKVAEVRGRKD